jgi:hypothetical protein
VTEKSDLSGFVYQGESRRPALGRYCLCLALLQKRINLFIGIPEVQVILPEDFNLGTEPPGIRFVPQLDGPVAVSFVKKNVVDLRPRQLPDFFQGHEPGFGRK